MKISINILRITFYFYVAIIFYLYLRPITELPQQDIFSDKHLHFIVFFVLGYIAQMISYRNKRSIFEVSFSLLIATFIEFIHAFIPFRSFEILDGLFNIIGCTTAIFIVYIYKRKKND
tara:strand:+ start:135 stop:488 length:354 start_codon:yes stop_codon:yes gene_type:complete